MMVTVLYLLKSQKASPKQVHQQLGVQQWFDLLQRCKLSVYDQVHAFVRDPQDTCARLLPKTVMFELAVGMLLGVFWRLDLQKPFLPLLSATDASTTHGFGASVAQLPIQIVRRLARVAEKQGDYVVMDGGTAKRLGEAHHLDISMGDFVDIFSVKARKGAHINVEAFLIWLRWVLRSRRRHCSRLVVLVDSAVWLGAAAKGRLLRKAAALEIAGELQVYLVLVPSAENPSDWPSRGDRRQRHTDKFAPCIAWQHNATGYVGWSSSDTSLAGGQGGESGSSSSKPAASEAPSRHLGTTTETGLASPKP
eukprot:s5136_g3.t1